MHLHFSCDNLHLSTTRVVGNPYTLGWFSSTFLIVQIPVHSNFDLVSLILVQFTTRTVAQMASQMIVCLSDQVSIYCNSKEIRGKQWLLF